MKVLLLSRYENLGASSRLRYLQYIPYLESEDVSIEVQPLFSNQYIKSLYAGRRDLCDIVKGYLKRMKALFGARRFDLLIIEKELFPYLPPWVEWLLNLSGIPYMVDYDDALFHRYDLHRCCSVRYLLGHKIYSVMRHARLVVAGNQYLAERARGAGAREVEIVPTVVDANRYRPLDDRPPRSKLTVGWIGTPKTSRYLVPLLPVFERLIVLYDVRFVAVGPNKSDFDDSLLEVLEWSEATEVQSIQQFDIGIMPLDDSPWERGKCGYKLIQYMACGLPVVASPVGVNKKLVESGTNGFLAETTQAWVNALEKMLSMSPQDRARMGTAGRKKVEKWYSIDVQAPRLLSAIKKALN